MFEAARAVATGAFAAPFPADAATDVDAAAVAAAPVPADVAADAVAAPVGTTALAAAGLGVTGTDV